jgi:hypothetical protein
MAVLEGSGVPTVTMATSQFAYEASEQWRALGFRERSVVEVAHPFGHLPEHTVHDEAARILEQVVALLLHEAAGSGGR